jgi:hypothetical protein
VARSPKLHVLAGIIGIISVLGAGCAWFPLEGNGNGDSFPERVIIVSVEMAKAIEDEYYYYIALDLDDDRTDGPLPVFRGPFWGNGWGAGSMTHYIEYHAGAYRVYAPRLVATLLAPSTDIPGTGQAPPSGITGAAGSPTDPVAGTHELTVGTITHGAVTVEPAGTITLVSNSRFQSAGTLTIETDAAGTIVADSVVYTPAELGGRVLTQAEVNLLDSLDDGATPLQATSLSTMGIDLTLAAAPVAGAQTLTLAPTTADVTDRFEANFGTGSFVERGVIYANATSEGPTPPIPGVTFQAGDLTGTGRSDIVTQFDPTSDFIGPPFQSTTPMGTSTAGRTLSFVLDLARIGAPEDRIDVNFITVNEIILDPQIEVAATRDYDGLGQTGNAFVSLDMGANFTYRNTDATEIERTGDASLGGVDIKSWEIEVRITSR